MILTHRTTGGVIGVWALILIVWLWFRFDIGFGLPEDPTSSGKIQSPAPVHEGSANVDSHVLTPTQSTTEDNRPLITYVYSESEESRRNYEFFLAHALHSAADFVFIFNGETTAADLLPLDRPNIRAIHRNNTCYDLGAHSEVLLTNDLYKSYRRFVLLNASVRGPFLPHWAADCWTEALLRRVTADTKLVGLTLNCWPTPHVQSMVWATDREGLELLLYPPATSPRHDAFMETLFSHASDFPRPKDYKVADPDWVERGINQCFADRQKAVEGEIAATGLILGAGKRVDVMLLKMQTEPDYVAHCARLGAWDPMGEGSYDGASVHPFETIFMKTNRGISPVLIENLSGWVDQMNYSSYDYC